MRLHIMILVVLALMLLGSQASFGWDKQIKARSLIVLLASLHHKSSLAHNKSINKSKAQGANKSLLLASANKAWSDIISPQKHIHQASIKK
ncbi:hypothetical protein [Cysteiniphilum litorale]|uniref:hypothetical protein n=1 Tax=Cysteiniphilum litorale TaxID=2056700 RepID=UPI003F8814B1